MAVFTNHFFGNLAAEPFAQQMFDFLQLPESIRAMKLAIRLGHTPLEGIAPELEQEFGQHFESPQGDRVRQMAGAMIKAILADEGFEVSAQGLKVGVGSQFSVATTYARKTGPKASPDFSKRYLHAIAELYRVPNPTRDYLLIPCGGVTIGVDDFRTAGRRVHLFSDRKSRSEALPQLTTDANIVAVTNKYAGRASLENRKGDRNHERRYLGWRWDPGEHAEDLAMACEMIETLRKAWFAANP